MRVNARIVIREVLAGSMVCLPLLSCMETTSAPLEPGRVSITVSVAGTYPSEAFQVELDGQSFTVPLGEQSLLVKVSKDGSHIVSLGRVPSGCVANGSTTARVQTSVATLSPVEFRVSCFSNGAIAVMPIVSEAGSPKSFLVTVDDDDTPLRVVGNAMTVLGTAFSGGAHTIRLSISSADCSMPAVLSKSVNVKTGGITRDTAMAKFPISCVALDPGVSGMIAGMLVDSATQGKLIDVAYPFITATSESGVSMTVTVSKDDLSSFTFRGLAPGRWTISTYVRHAWVSVFPGLQLYRDTTFTVDVRGGQTTDVGRIFLRPRPLLLLIGVNSCPWALPDPPTVEDWWNCDGGYWGGIKLDIDVTGVEGTATAAEHFHGTIGSGLYVWPAQSWEETEWSVGFNVSVPGDYDVKIVGIPQSSPGGTVAWRLVPWENSTTRVTVSNVIGYVGLDFWYH